MLCLIFVVILEIDSGANQIEWVRNDTARGICSERCGWSH